MIRLKQLRTEKGWNMRETARALGIPYTTYISYEKGDREPNSEMLIKFADFFHVSIDYLIGMDRKDETDPVVRMDEFTFAMHNHSGQLTEKDKEILLAMAQQLTDAHKRKDSDGEADGDL